ncbi:hypothetical protein VTN49DRAFT_6957 [Thermomyces lanuginosus]|uniref:uncharacterized protein n=1 Tax=Thermomyces lanuginosus TaxID=5541 RepID=UPI003743F67A
MDILFKRNDINKDDEEARNTSQTLTVLLGVVLGVATVIVSCFLLTVYLNRRRPSDSVPDKSTSKHRLKKLETVCPTRRLDQWWPTVKDTLNLPDVVDSHFVCVVCLEPVLPEHEIRELKCMHVFHRDCLEKWFLRNHFTCPLCHRVYYNAESSPPVHDLVWMV